MCELLGMNANVPTDICFSFAGLMRRLFRGEVILNAETDFAEQRFRVGRTLYARVGSAAIEPLQVTAVRFQQGRPIIGVAGIGSIGEAGSFRVGS